MNLTIINELCNILKGVGKTKNTLSNFEKQHFEYISLTTKTTVHTVLWVKNFFGILKWAEYTTEVWHCRESPNSLISCLLKVRYLEVLKY